MTIELYSRKLNKIALACYKRLNAEKLFCEEAGDSTEGLSVEKRNFGTHPHLFVKWNETVIKSVRKYIKNDWRMEDEHCLGAGKTPFLHFLSAFLCVRLSADFRLKFLSESNAAEKIYLFEYPSMMDLLSTEKLKSCKSGREFSKALKDSARCILATMIMGFKYFKILPFKKKRVGVKYFVVPYYQSVNSNAEFFTFYDAIDDGAVLVDSGTDLCQHLERRGCKIIARNDLYINPWQVLGLMMESSALLWHVVFHHRELLLVNAVFRYLKEKAIIMSYFNAVSPKYVCVVRGDMYAAATLLREFSNKQGTKTVSFSHASNYYPQYFLSSVDFDYFGVSGHRELEVYRPYWNRDSNYIITGQFTADYESKMLVLPFNSSHTPGLSVGVFPTTVNDVVIPNSQNSFDDFVQAVVLAVSKVNDSTLYYKSKTKLKALRGDSSDQTISDDGRAIQVFENSLSGRYIDLDENYTAYDMYGLIDIGFVYSMSTCAFELMQKKRKVIVFVPFEKELHPFYKFTPLLVSSSIDEFIDNAMRVIAMSSEEYYLYIKSTLDYCLIDNDTDSLASKFIAAIETASTEHSVIC